MREDINLNCPACGAKKVPHRWRPSSESGPFWRCSNCNNATLGGRDADEEITKFITNGEHWKARSEVWKKAAIALANCKSGRSGGCGHCRKFFEEALKMEEA